MTRCYSRFASWVSHPAGLQQGAWSREPRERWADERGAQRCVGMPLWHNTPPEQSYLCAVPGMWHLVACPAQPYTACSCSTDKNAERDGCLWDREPPASAHRTKAERAGPGTAGSSLVDWLPWKHAGEEGWQPWEQRASILTRLRGWGFPPQPAHGVWVRRRSLLFFWSVSEMVLWGGAPHPLHLYGFFLSPDFSFLSGDCEEWTQRMPQCCSQAEREAIGQHAFLETVTILLPQALCVGTYSRLLGTCTADQQMKMQEKQPGAGYCTVHALCVHGCMQK